MRPLRLGWILSSALIIGVGISQLILTLPDWHLRDMGAYWEAAIRLREDAPLYPPIVETEASEVYRYAPWFAWAWVPLTLLPKEVVNLLWSAILLGASAAALVPMLRVRAWLAVAFFAPILVGISATGNVQALLVAVLVLGVERRSGPLWIAAAASLKAVPIFFVVTYLGRREWARAAMTLLLTTVLVAPMLLHDLGNYPSDAGAAAVLLTVPPLYAIVVAAGIVISVRLARHHVAWLAAATTVVLALPRFFVYDITFLLTAIPDGWKLARRHDRASTGNPETQMSSPTEERGQLPLRTSR